MLQTTSGNATSTDPMELATDNSAASSRAPECILVVDDEPSIDRLYTQRFRHEIASGEWKFIFAHDGLEALQKLRETPDVAVLLVDLNMPQMDGLTFLGELAKLHLAGKAVVVSAYGDMKNIRAAMNRGAFDFLCKPVDFQDVETTIRKTLQQVQEIRQSRRAEEYRQAKEAAEHDLKQLEKLEILRDDLTQMIVHDMRTPMTSFIGGLEVMQMWGDLSVRQRNCLTISLRGGTALVAMINDLLDVSKMEAGLLRLNLQEVHLEELIAVVLEQVVQLGEQCGLQLQTKIAPDLPTLHADADKLQRTLMNLFSNSIKFTPAGGEITLSVKQSDDGKSIVFVVTDTGYGVPEEERERIFDKYSQVERFKQDKMVSSGLGLTFCKMVAEAHGGCIWVESEAGEGSMFFLTLPLTPTA